jgi:aminotransferase
MMKIHQYAIMCASIIAQEAAVEALVHGESAAAEMREQYKLRRNFIVGALNNMGLPCHLPRGSFYAFPDIRSTGLPSKEFALRLLQEEKVAAVPGGAFGASGEGFMRMCFATAFDKIQIAMERTDRFVGRCRKG